MTISAGQPTHADGGDSVLALAQIWLTAVVAASFVPAGRARTRVALAELVRRLVAALVADPFDATAGRPIGAELVRLNIATPQALGQTLTVLGTRLPAVAGVAGGADSALPALLGQVAAGFTEALRDHALAAAESLNRAERAAWRGKQRRLHQRHQHALLHDQLTALPNRHRLGQVLQELIATRPGHERLALCVLSLDRYTAVTDSLGPEHGDQLLLAVAKRLSDLAARHGYFLAHLGGDEFVLLAENTNGTEAADKLADQATSEIPDPFPLSGHHIPMAVRAGAVERGIAGAAPTGLLRAAHTTLRWVRADNRRRWAVFDPRRGAADLERHTLTAAMPASLARGEFTLAYQPLVRLADRAVVAVEALARWRHPTFGLLRPDQFIALAEDTGLIEPLGLYLLQQACAQAAAWHRSLANPPLMSVNLAVAQLRHPELPAAVMSTLDSTGLPADRLQLEVTESAVVDPDGPTAVTLRILADQGVRLAIDDFGTGYSSLAYLSELPVHAIKLAARFLRGTDDAAANRQSNLTIIPALINLGHELGLTVTAEGIERAAQARLLTSLNCDLGQGYHLGRPTTPGKIARRLSA